MEFPDLGENCSRSNCNQLDFIPFKCQCGSYFCREHFLNHSLSEECPNYVDVKKSQVTSTNSVIYRCEYENCKGSSIIRMPCEKCDKHHCVSHRFHSACYDQISESVILENEKIKLEDEKNEKTRQMIEAEVTQRLRKAEQSSKAKTALKVLHMKLKSKAVGEKNIPISERIYFAVRSPLDITGKTLQESPIEMSVIPNNNDTLMKPIFVSRKWPLGRVVDSLADVCKLKNSNNIIGAPKLRLFRESDGMCIGLKELNMGMSVLLEDKILIDGDRVFLEYISADYINTTNENSVYFFK